MFKRQHYAFEHSGRDSASSDSSSSQTSSSLGTASDGDSGDAEHGADAACPASSRESDESSQEEVVEVENSTPVAARRAEAIRVAERKLAEAAEDAGEFEDEFNNADEGPDLSEGSEDESEGCDAERSDDSKGNIEIREAGKTNVTSPAKACSDGESSDIEPTDELLAQRKIANQWAQTVDEDELERKLDIFEGNTVICVGDENNVFKCRVCPKIVCLNDETMQAHLASKRHRRSKKQLAEGRLKIQLDSDGEIEEDGETHAERYTRTVAAAEERKEESRKRKRNSGRQRQRNRDKGKNKALDKSEICVPITAGKNRETRRRLLHGEMAEVRTGQRKNNMKRKERKKPRGEANGKKKS